MTPEQEKAIRERDALTTDPIWFAPMQTSHFVSLAARDRRALLRYADELRADLREWEITEQGSTIIGLRAELAALREAAGKVVDAWDSDALIPVRKSIADLRAILERKP